MFKPRFIGAALLGLASAALPFAAMATMSMNTQDSAFVTKAGQAGGSACVAGAQEVQQSARYQLR